MTLRFLVDAQLPVALARWLVAAGYIADHVSDLGLEAASDTVIWQEALRLHAVIVTKDEDFVVPRRKPPVPQVVWVRMGNCTKAQLLTRMTASFDDVVAALAGGEKVVELR